MSNELKVPGFRAGAVSAGLRRGQPGELDLCLMVCDTLASAAGTFTQNVVRAAPVILSSLRVKRGQAQAILVNAGCANAMTGPPGRDAAQRTTAMAADILGLKPVHVLAASTGVIGTQLDVARIEAALPKLLKSLRPDGFSLASRSIMTTDKVPKTIKVSFPLERKRATLLGMAKGAGMIAPDMATMLAFLFTDAAAAPQFLQVAFRSAVGESFNRVRVDGDTSTNDTALILAGGAVGNTPLGLSSSHAARSFEGALSDACFALAEMMVRDGEGATRIMDIRVNGARFESDAIKIAKAIADSPLVKTALHGADPNWGRIAAAAGRSGAKIDPNRLHIVIGGVECVSGGVPAPHFDEKRAAAAMKKPTVIVEVNIGLGESSTRFLSSDLTAEYIRINAHYRT